MVTGLLAIVVGIWCLCDPVSTLPVLAYFFAAAMCVAGWYYHDLLKQNHNFGSIQIAVSVPLTGWWSGTYAIKRKNLELINAQKEMQDLSEQLQIEMQDKWNNLTAAHRKMEIEKQ